MSLANTQIPTTSAKKLQYSVCTTQLTLQTPPPFALPKGLSYDTCLKQDGLQFLSLLPAQSIRVAFFDPQYRGVLDKLQYGNEGKSRGQSRAALNQMSTEVIHQFIQGIDLALAPSGHLFLWMDKFHLCTGFADWLTGTNLHVVDLITWDKMNIGMGYRTRRRCEYVVVLQKTPKRAKGVWTNHCLPDIHTEKAIRNGHAHQKPIELQAALIEAVSDAGDVVIDPAAGSFSVLEACRQTGRNFLGCDIEG